MRIEHRAIDLVTPYEKNPRKIGELAIEAVAASIRDFGWQQPIVVDKDNVVIVGHTRLLAARRLNLAKVPVVVADLSEDEARAYRLVDNRTHEFSEWEWSLRDHELKALLDADFKYDLEPYWGKGELRALAEMDGASASRLLDDTGSGSGSGSKTTTCPKCGHEF